MKRNLPLLSALLLTIFPIKPCVTFLTGSPFSVPHTIKLESGIFVISTDFGTGQSISKFPLVTSVYRKIWTIVGYKRGKWGKWGKPDLLVLRSKTSQEEEQQQHPFYTTYDHAASGW